MASNGANSRADHKRDATDSAASAAGSNGIALISLMLPPVANPVTSGPISEWRCRTGRAESHRNRLSALTRQFNAWKARYQLQPLVEPQPSQT
ncbi:hypothetical protein GCM10009780_58830 [Actinomadura alba]